MTKERTSVTKFWLACERSKSGRHGRVVNLPGVASIRKKTGLSQGRFATLLGVSKCDGLWNHDAGRNPFGVVGQTTGFALWRRCT